MNISINNPGGGRASLLTMFMRDTEAGKWWVQIMTDSRLQWVLKLEIKGGNWENAKCGWL